VPLAAFAQIQADVLTVRALVARPDGSRVVRSQVSGPVAQAERLGEQAAAELLEQGARDILASIPPIDQAQA
jgi:hydroxymethylbilane synthase